MALVHKLFDTPSYFNIKLHFFLQKAEGRQALAECLLWQPFDEEIEMQKSIQLDFLHDSLMFSVDKGFSWDKVVAILEFSAELLQEIAGTCTSNKFFFCAAFYIRPNV